MAGRGTCFWGWCYIPVRFLHIDLLPRSPVKTPADARRVYAEWQLVIQALVLSGVAVAEVVGLLVMNRILMYLETGRLEGREGRVCVHGCGSCYSLWDRSR